MFIEYIEENPGKSALIGGLAVISLAALISKATTGKFIPFGEYNPDQEGDMKPGDLVKRGSPSEAMQYICREAKKLDPKSRIISEWSPGKKICYAAQDLFAYYKDAEFRVPVKDRHKIGKELY